MRLTPLAILLALPALAAQSGAPVESLISAVRSALQARRPDPEIASLVRRTQLSERLDSAVLEQMETEGAGPLAMEALDHIQSATRQLNAPARPPILFDAPPTPALEARQSLINRAALLATDYTRSLPDFICTQTVRRFRGRRAPENWNPTDTLTIKLSFSLKHGEEHSLVAINGKPTRRTYEQAGGTTSRGEFADILHEIFRAATGTQFAWERWSNLRGRRTAVFRYEIELARSSSHLFVNAPGRREVALVGQHGLVYLDPESGRAWRLTREADHIPPGFPVQSSWTQLDYDFQEVGGQSVLLPLRAELRLSTGRNRTRNVVEFRDYQKFSADTTVTFQKQ